MSAELPATVPWELPPLGLYVHMPWCVRKCPYCDFNSYQAPAGQLPEQAYISALIADLEGDLSHVAGRRVETIFFGGGTPSLFSPESLSVLLDGIRSRIDVAPDVEITLEANPGTIERGRFAGYWQAGINRVSLGAQTFSPSALQRLGRIHSPDDTHRAVGELRQAGYDNYNLDLMYALPDQTLELAVFDLQQAIGLGSSHLSYYHLTLEVGTAFYHRPPPLPEDEVTALIESQATQLLGSAGFERYEVSAWAKPGAACRHNLNYWRYGDYLGIGAGAHGKLSLPSSNAVIRTVKPRNPATYVKALSLPGGIGQRQHIDLKDRPFEFMLNATRLAAGFAPEMFERRTGVSWSVVAPVLARLQDRGLITVCATLVQTTDLGWRFLNDVQEAFLVS